MLVLPQFDNSYDGDYLLISRILSQSSYQSIRTTAAAALSEYSLQAPVDPGCCVVDRLKEMVNSESSEQRLAGARALENVLAASSEEDAATLCADIGNTLHNPLLSMALRIQSVEAFRAPEIRAAQQVGFSLFSRCGKLSIADAETIRRTLDAYIQIIARDIGSSGDVITLAANVENVLTPVRLLLSDAGDRAELTRRIYLPSLERMFDLIRPGQFLSDATILLAVTMEDTDLENLKCTIDSWRTGEGNERYLEFVLEYAPDSRLSRIISNDFTRQIGGLVIDLGDPPMENLP